MLKNKIRLKLLTALLLSLSLFGCDDNAVNEALGKNNIQFSSLATDTNNYIPGGVHVRANAKAGGDGSTWQKAFNDLQKAIDKAKKDGGIVYVAQGTYKPNSHPNGGSGERNKHFALRNNVVVIGGYTTNRDKRDKDPTKTILTGDLGNKRVLNVFYNKGLNKTSKLKYFTITKGKADGANKDSGGAMYNDNSSPSLISINFEDNEAKNSGGAIYNSNSTSNLISVNFRNNNSNNGGGMYNANKSSPKIVNCRFNNNTATKSGGAMYNDNSSPKLMDSYFTGNKSIGDDWVDGGGGVYNKESSPTLTNVKFTNNTANRHGGGMYNNNSSPKLMDSYFTGNKSNDSNWPSGGGGMYNYFSSPILTNVKFTNNTANRHGGGMYNHYSSSTLTNVKFTSNTATYYGGGMYNFKSSPTLTNVKFTSNTTTYYGGGMVNDNNSSPTLDNTVIFNKNIAGSVEDKKEGKGGAIYNLVGSKYYPDSRIIGTPTYGIGNDENKKVVKVDNTYKLVKSNLESGPVL